MAAFAGFGRRGGFPGFGGMGQGNQNQNGAQRASVRVIAVSDEQSNSVIVSAPEDVMTSIADVISRLDTNIADVTETQIFRLQHADASELADVLNTLYADSGSSSNSNGGRGQGFQMGGWPGFGQPQNNANSQRSKRALLQSRVVAVPDARTNSVIVSAARETMAQIAVTVGRLDSTDANKQHVFVHHLENADPDNVASILRGMFSTQGSDTSANQPSSSRLNQRTTTGATNDGSNILSTNGSSSGSRLSR
jgi:type II secretory pathway component GspD/PulD (secretin)